MISSCSEINSTKKTRGRARKLSSNQEQIVKQIILAYTQDGRATATDAHIAARLAEIEQIYVSAQMILRLRRQLGIAAVPRGGARPGGGRPRKAPAERRQKTCRKLLISDYALVRACLSAYDVENAIYNKLKEHYYVIDPKTGNKKKVSYAQKYKPRFRQAGLRTYCVRTMPTPTRTEIAQAFDAIRGGSK